MSSSSPSSSKYPKTPSTPRWSSSLFNCKPTHSSPLALASSSPQRDSPVFFAQSRRRQFKAMLAQDASTPRVRRQLFAIGAHPHAQSLGSDDSPQKAFLRNRFKEKCVERVQKARERNVKMKRWGSDLSSDGFDMDAEMDVDEGDDDVDESGLDDELFRRIIANENRRRVHAFRLSYELDVGSSIDPNMEDVAALEQELLAATQTATVEAQSHKQTDVSYDEIPDEWDVDDDDLAAMYDEYMREQEKQQMEESIAEASMPASQTHECHGEGPMNVTMDSIMED